ncbi:hypothetical protein CBER1_05871 [Cercospora berteroae]|uniref:Uncharacterized protein n=1 Tax=Cercospora berteroae TaxID=357750 RepID=A0A2S6C7K2_9PEZI|nr:hypothetical protein CBER1_05871 [Cercospora berteroae]
MARRVAPRMPLGELNHTTYYTKDRKGETDISLDKAALAATSPTESTYNIQSKATYKFIEEISALISPLLKEVEKPTSDRKKLRQAFDPFAREFLLSAPESTIKLLAQLCVAPLPLLKDKNKKLGIFDLATETRLQIYNEVFEQRWEDYRTTQRRTSKHDYLPPPLSTSAWKDAVAAAMEPLEPAILRVNKLVRQEGLGDYGRFLEKEAVILRAKERELKKKIRDERKHLAHLWAGQSSYVGARMLDSHAEKVGVREARMGMEREMARLERMGWLDSK